MPKSKEFVNTPMNNALHSSVPSAHVKGNPGEYDKNHPAIVSHPHSMGKDTLPLKFFEGGKELTPDPEKFQTPFNNTLYVKGAKKQGSDFQTPGKK